MLQKHRLACSKAAAPLSSNTHAVTWIWLWLLLLLLLPWLVFRHMLLLLCCWWRCGSASNRAMPTCTPLLRGAPRIVAVVISMVVVGFSLLLLLLLLLLIVAPPLVGVTCASFASVGPLSAGHPLGTMGHCSRAKKRGKGCHLAKTQTRILGRCWVEDQQLRISLASYLSKAMLALQLTGRPAVHPQAL